jgi:hypothetical protein
MALKEAFPDLYGIDASVAAHVELSNDSLQ